MMIRGLNTLIFAVIFILSIHRSHAQNRTVAERLGYPADTKLLILHADDLGVAHSINRATMEAITKGPVQSASIMAPCPWLAEVAAWNAATPGLDLGLHLTLTSEWSYLKWGPIASSEMVSSLLDANGYFFDNCDSMAAHAKPEEVELELRAQIERVKAMGIEPTHFDTHMGCLYQTNLDLFKVYLKLGREYHLPLRIGRGMLDAHTADFQQLVTDQDIVIDRIYSATPEDFKKGMATFYEKALREMKPGLNEIVIHLGYRDAEMQGVAYNHPDWGAAWRQADLDFFTSDACRKMLEEENIRIVTFREIGKLLK